MTISQRTPLKSFKPGVTLIELSIVILVLLTFLGMTFIGIKAWKSGADRAGCIVNIRNMQQSVRSFSNMNGLTPGENTSLLTPPVNLSAELVGTGRYIETAPTCPGQGFYVDKGSQIPQIGTLYMTCSLSATEGHEPATAASW